MDLDEKLIIKVQLNDEIRKMPIHNEEITYDELIIMMERVFKHKLSPNDEITIKYKDEDNDLITISDDSDLAFAIESSKVLKLVLTVQNDEEEVDKNEKQFGSLDLKTIRKELQLIRDHTNKLLDKVVHLNNDASVNTNGSGRTSATGVGDYHGVGGKEFDPLSVGHQTNFPPVERTGSSASITSNIRQDDSSIKSNIERTKQSPSKERQFESRDTHRPSPIITKSQNTPPPMTTSVATPQMNPAMYPSHMTPTNIHSSANTTNFNLPPSTVGAGQNLPPQHVGGPNMLSGNLPPQRMNLPSSSSPIGTGQYLPSTSMTSHQLPPSNMGGANLSPSNIGGHNMPPSSMGGPNMSPSSVGGPNMPPQSMGGLNMPPSSMGGHNMPPSSMGGHNMPPSSMGGPNMPPPSMGGPNIPPASMGGHNMPPSNVGAPNMPPFNPASQNDSTGKMPVYMGQTMQGGMNIPRPAFYPPGTMSGQTRPNPSQFNAPNSAGNVMPNGQQMRPSMPPPTGASYFNPQSNMPSGGQMFNPQMQQQQQNTQFGYQQNK